MCKKGGVVSFIVPSTWMFIEQALPLREYLLKNTSLKVLATLPQSVFTANVDSMIILFLNSVEEKNKVLTFEIPLKNSLEDISAYLVNGRLTNQSEWLNSEKFIFTIGQDKIAYDLILKIKKDSKRFSDFIYTKQGLIPYLTKEEGRENKYISKEKIDDNWDCYFDGSRCVDRYTTKGVMSYVKYGEWLYAPREKEIFNQPRIIFQLIRNISLKRRIVATYLDKKIYSDRNTGLIFLKPNIQIELKFILGILNSKLINFLHSKTHNSTYISFPSIEALPIVLGSNDFQKNIIALVDNILQKKINKESTEELENNIDELVMDLYGLNDGEKEIIRNS